MKKKLLIFASGTATGGGSGFEKLAINAQLGKLGNVEIVGVVSNHANGGVKAKAEKYGIPFFYFPGPWTAGKYQTFVGQTEADFVALSGWLKLVKGLDSKTTFNIHPGPLPAFGGKGLYGHHVHEAVIAAYKKGAATHSAVTMHFVTDEYDQGPIFFQFEVKIFPDDTAETLGTRVNKVEHAWQSDITARVIAGEICWDGKNPLSLVGKLEYKDIA